ncbi:hypothetical protein SAFG77S_05771 [Streptomyces afghaniensis]
MTSRHTAGRALALLLAAVTALPVGIAGAAPVPPAPGPLGELVPGVAPGPAQPWSVDTPDQALPPLVYTPSAEEEAVEPRRAVEGTYARVEYVPLGEAVARVSCTGKAGSYQRQVERWPGLRADGVQSAADCRVIRAFQVRQGIKPAIGFAGPVTWGRMQYLSLVDAVQHAHAVRPVLQRRAGLPRPLRRPPHHRRLHGLRQSLRPRRAVAVERAEEG